MVKLILILLLLTSCEITFDKSELIVTIVKSNKNAPDSAINYVIERVSQKKFTGVESIATTGSASLSFDGKIIAFSTYAKLLPIDTDDQKDIYTYNKDTGLFTLISVALDGFSGNSISAMPKISADGNFVVFTSAANNLVSNDTNGFSDIFVRDISAGTTVRINLHTDGTQANNNSSSGGISDDGRYAVFLSSANNLVTGDVNYQDIFLHDLQTSTTTRVSQETSGTNSNADSYSPQISGNGQFIAFESRAGNLTASDTNGRMDVFVYDRIANTLDIASKSSTNVQTNGFNTYLKDISPDGRYILFSSDGTNLVASDTNSRIDLFLRDRNTSTTDMVSLNEFGNQLTGGTSSGRMSEDAQLIIFSTSSSGVVSNDTNTLDDVFLLNRGDSSVIRLSQKIDGTQASNDGSYPEISRDGKVASFESISYNLVTTDYNNDYDIFLYSIDVPSLQRIPANEISPEANDYNDTIYLSADGRYATFVSAATNLYPEVNWAYNSFRKDMKTGDIYFIAQSATGEIAQQDSYENDISADGNIVVFSSQASNLVPGDTNGQFDIFVKNISTGQINLISKDASNNLANGYCDFPGISADGNVIAFVSTASNLVPGDTNSRNDVFWYNRTTGEMRLISKANDGTIGDSNASYQKPYLSSDGNKVVYSSLATNLVAGDINGAYDVFLYDAVTDQTTLISKDNSGTIGNANSQWAAINVDGTKVIFHSYATNLVPGDTNGVADTFVHDIASGLQTRVSESALGVQSNGQSHTSSSASLSKDGRYAAFSSAASNLVNNDTNGSYDVFVKDLELGRITRVSVNKDGVEGDDDSYESIITQDGKLVGFASDAKNFLDNYNQKFTDIFLAPVNFTE